MDKLIFKRIAKDWTKSILLACGSDSFDELIEDGVLSEDEAKYILNEAHLIAERITKDTALTNLRTIVEKYYDIGEA